MGEKKVYNHIAIISFITILFLIISILVSRVDAYGYTQEKLKTPSIVAVNDIDDNQLVVTWKKVDNARKYEVYRSTQKDGSFKKIATVAKNKKTYSDKTIKNNKTYYYKVKAVASKSKYNSKLSKAKSGKVCFDGKLFLDSNSVYLNQGGVAMINVSAENHGDLVFEYENNDEEYITCVWEDWQNDDGSWTLSIWCNKEKTDTGYSDIIIHFGDRNNLIKKTIRVNYDYTDDNRYSNAYNNCIEVSDLGAFYDVSPICAWHFSDGKRLFYVYDLEEILSHNLGQTVSQTIDLYKKDLTQNGCTYISQDEMTGIKHFLGYEESDEEYSELPDTLPGWYYVTKSKEYGVTVAVDTTKTKGYVTVFIESLNEKKF